MREHAFILIFERIFIDYTVDEIIENATECSELEMNDDIKKLFKGVEENKSVVDSEIEKYLKKWSINRISKVSLAILRLAVYEIMFCDETPLSVSIDEAVELAKTYSVPEDASFINGVLGSFAKDFEASK
jgi:N utilization substance protein B